MFAQLELLLAGLNLCGVFAKLLRVKTFPGGSMRWGPVFICPLSEMAILSTDSIESQDH